LRTSNTVRGGHKHESNAGNGKKTTAILSKTQINLKLISGRRRANE